METDIARTPGAPSAARGSAARLGPAAVIAALRDYFVSDSRRTIQTMIGLLWLVDGGLQFQPFMYSNGFLQTLTGMEAGQPHWLSASIAWGARFAHTDLGVWNTLSR